MFESQIKSILHTAELKLRHTKDTFICSHACLNDSRYPHEGQQSHSDLHINRTFHQ